MWSGVVLSLLNINTASCDSVFGLVIAGVDERKTFSIANEIASLEVALTTLAQRTRQTQKMHAVVTYLHFHIQVRFLVVRAFISSGNVQARPKMYFSCKFSSPLTANFDL